MKLSGLRVLYLILLLVPGCGYRPAYPQPSGGERFAVVPAQPLVGHVGAVEATLVGVRDELAKAGRLRSGEGYPRLVVEVVRIREVATGLAASSEVGAVARGTAVSVVGRVWIERGPDVDRARDTGDMQRTERYAPESDLRLERARYDQAVRSAARDLGRALALRALGHPTPPWDPL